MSCLNFRSIKLWLTLSICSTCMVNENSESNQENDHFSKFHSLVCVYTGVGCMISIEVLRMSILWYYDYDTISRVNLGVMKDSECKGGYQKIVTDSGSSIKPREMGIEKIGAVNLACKQDLTTVSLPQRLCLHPLQPALWLLLPVPLAGAKHHGETFRPEG